MIPEPIQHRIADQIFEIRCECGRVFRAESDYKVHSDYETHRRRVEE